MYLSESNPYSSLILFNWLKPSIFSFFHFCASRRFNSACKAQVSIADKLSLARHACSQSSGVTVTLIFFYSLLIRNIGLSSVSAHVCEAICKIAGLLLNGQITPSKCVYFPPLIFLHSVMLCDNSYFKMMEQMCPTRVM